MCAVGIDFGLGLRPEHYEEIAASPGRVSWFEALSENYMVPGGGPLHWLDRFRRDYPMALHGVSLSIGSIDPLDRAYLDDLKALVGRVQPMWVSDHLCFTGLRGQNMHDLLPLPYTEEALDHVAERVMAVQDHLGRRLVLENVSSYVTYAASELSEWEFIAELAKRADCEILLDVNNVYVSAFNHEFDALAFLRGMPRERVRQFHLAGHTHKGTHIIDTHDHPDRARRLGALWRGRKTVPGRADHDRARRRHPALRRASGRARRRAGHRRRCHPAGRLSAPQMNTNAGSNVGSLGDLQRAFQDYLLASSDSFQAAVRDTRKADRITLLDVYRDGYALRLIEVLDQRLSRPDGDGGPGRLRPHGARLYRGPSVAPSVDALVRQGRRGFPGLDAALQPHAGSGGDGALRMGAGRGLRLARRDARRGRRADGAAARGVGDARLHRPALAAAADS